MEFCFEFFSIFKMLLVEYHDKTYFYMHKRKCRSTALAVVVTVLTRHTLKPKSLDVPLIAKRIFVCLLYCLTSLSTDNIPT